MTRNQMLFDIYLIIMLFTKGLGLTDGPVYKVCLAAASAAAVVKILTTRHSRRAWVVIVALLVLGGVNWRYTGNQGALLCILLVLSMQGIALGHAMRVGAVCWGLTYVFQIATQLLNLRARDFVIHQKFGFSHIIRWGLGYTHPNVLQIATMALIAYVFYSYRYETVAQFRRLWIAAAGLSAYIFLYSLSVTGIMMTVVFLVFIAYLEGCRFCGRTRNVVENALLQVLFPLCVLFSVLAPILLEGRAFEILNKVMTHRPGLSRYFLTTYGLLPFGGDFSGLYAGYTLDCSYMNLLMNGGWILFAVMCVGYVLLIHDLVQAPVTRENNVALAIVLYMVVGAVSEPFAFNTSFKNVSLLILGSWLYRALGDCQEMPDDASDGISVITDCCGVMARWFAQAGMWIGQQVSTTMSGTVRHKATVAAVSLVIGLACAFGYGAVHVAPQEVYALRVHTDMVEDYKELYYTQEEITAIAESEDTWVMEYRNADTPMVLFSHEGLGEIETVRTQVTVCLFAAIVAYVLFMIIGNRRKLILLVIVAIQMVGAVYLCNHTYAGGDAIFTFTLANTPYEFNYIDSKIDRFPNSNGWMDAGILREQYETTSYDRFNYSSVYWHQRLDNHPLLYYSLVHTVCSLFPASYSIWYALIINLVALLFIDLILIRVARFLFPESGTAPAVLLVAATSIVAFYEMTALARMYMLLALMAVWFLWICIRLVYEERVSWWEIYLCVLLGSQTHYYDYVFAALAGFLTLCMLARDHAWKRIWGVVRTTGMAVCTSLIIFPWVVWHIVFNQMDKNTTLRMWDLETLTGWLSFVNESVFNGRGMVWLVLAVAAVICAMIGRGKATGEAESEDASTRSLRRFWILTGCSTLIFSMGIYTLNGAVRYYATPVYLPSAIMMTALVITLWQVVKAHWSLVLRGRVAEVVACLAVMLVALGGISSNVEHFSSVSEEYGQYLAFHQVMLDHPDADCLYVAEGDDNLLQGLWFDLAGYDEFRKVYVDEYETLLAAGDTGIAEILDGRETDGTVILYVPVTETLPEAATYVTALNRFQVAVYE